MKSTRQKGNAFQYFCAIWLRDQGYDVYNQTTVATCIKPGVWRSQHQDIFGCDIIAMKAGEKPLFIQATAHSNVQKRLDEILKHPWPLEHVVVQVWQKKANKEINIKEFNGKELIDHAKIIRRKLFFLTQANQ